MFTHQAQRMKSSSKQKQQQAENKRGGISSHMFTLHQRLYNALNLGLRCYDDRGRKWQSSDIGIQTLVVRSIDAFLDSISRDTLRHPLVKDSIADMVGALRGILQFKNQYVLGSVLNLAVKMISTLPSPILQDHILSLVHPLSSLLSYHQLQVAVSCASALSLILSNLSNKSEKEVWEILKETKTVTIIVRNIQDFSADSQLIEYIQEMVSLLSRILWRWPPCRFSVWSDTRVMHKLESISMKPESSVKVSILKLYSAIALCGSGAENLLENGDTLVQMMIRSMGDSHPDPVRLEGFRLAQCLVMSEQGCLKILKMCCEPFINAIINGMSIWSLRPGQLSEDQMSILSGAFRLAMITCWAGDHHHYFWKLGIEGVLLASLLNKFCKACLPADSLSLEELIVIAQEGLSANVLLVLRPFIWDILGGLAAHCVEDLNFKVRGYEFQMNILITCACLAFVDSLRSARQIYRDDIANSFGNEPASRTVLMMVYSPCKYIASQTRLLLCELLKKNGSNDIKHLLNGLDALSSGKNFDISGNLQVVINLVSLACYSGLAQYRKDIMKMQGMRKLWGFTRWWSSNPIHIKRLSVAPHLYNPYTERTCCYNFTESWEGEDMLLLFSLWGLAELIRHFGLVKNHSDTFSRLLDWDETQLVSELQKLYIDTHAPGPKWYAACILSYLGIYGFPSELGERFGRALYEKDHTDLKMVLMNQECLSVHCVILMIRCPGLLPADKMVPDGSCTSCDKEIRLSAHVDQPALLKLLEFTYSGYLRAGEDLVKKLKTIARHCNLQSLLQLLCRKSLKWGTPIPTFDLSDALGLSGLNFSDIIVEAEANDSVNWACGVCSRSVPHMHLHKIVLCSNCNYFRALFHSGMQESHLQTLKAPVSWEALVKLTYWFYTSKLPMPKFGCFWDNLDAEKQLYELQSHIQLCWLSEFWLLERVHEECSKIVLSCLDSARHLAVNVIQLAAKYSQSWLAEAAASHMAPFYHRLRNSGELDALDEDLVEMVRVASVRFSQGQSSP